MSAILSVRVDDEVAAWVRGFAAGRGVSRTAVIEAALWRLLEREGGAARMWRCPVHGLVTDGALLPPLPDDEACCGVSCPPDGACGLAVEPAEFMVARHVDAAQKAPGGGAK